MGTNTAKTSSNVGTNRTQSMSGGCLIGELERVTEKEKLKQELRKQKDEINEEIDLTRLKDEIDFYFGRENDNFFLCGRG